ncbi:hypothetical protein SESBI_20722 [Sesbania bispinosa]|nr:hypothetical protein SESBI_20722 [Sesbania bispinosa]
MAAESTATAADGRGYGRWRTHARVTAAARRRSGGEGRQPLGAADRGASAGEAAHDVGYSGGGYGCARRPEVLSTESCGGDGY